MRIVSPCFPQAGLTAVIPICKTIKAGPGAETPLTVTVPEELPLGTITKSVSDLAFITWAGMPLNLTVSNDGFRLKLFPVMIIVSPCLALRGFTPEMPSPAAVTVKAGPGALIPFNSYSSCAIT